jgi:hypothetical protein
MTDEVWKYLVPLLAAAVTGFITWLVTHFKNKADAARMKAEAASQHKSECYRELIQAMHDLAFKRSVARGRAQCGGAGAQDKPSQDEYSNAKKAILLAHVCAPKSLLDSANATFSLLVNDEADEAQVNEALCRMVSEVREDLGLELAQFDNEAMNEAERLMVRACCEGTRYKVTVEKDGRSPERASYAVGR